MSQAAVGSCGLALQFAAESLKLDEDVVWCAVKQDWRVWRVWRVGWLCGLWPNLFSEVAGGQGSTSCSEKVQDPGALVFAPNFQHDQAFLLRSARCGALEFADAGGDSLNQSTRITMCCTPFWAEFCWKPPQPPERQNDITTAFGGDLQKAAVFLLLFSCIKPFRPEVRQSIRIEGACGGHKRGSFFGPLISKKPWKAPEDQRLHTIWRYPKQTDIKRPFLRRSVDGSPVLGVFPFRPGASVCVCWEIAWINAVTTNLPTTRAPPTRTRIKKHGKNNGAVLPLYTRVCCEIAWINAVTTNWPTTRAPPTRTKIKKNGKKQWCCTAAVHSCWLIRNWTRDCRSLAHSSSVTSSTFARKMSHAWIQQPLVMVSPRFRKVSFACF